MAIHAMVHQGLTKGQRKEWRRKGYATASLYGRGIEPVQLLVPVREVIEHITQQGGKSKAVLDLQFDGAPDGTCRVRVKEIQRHLTSQQPIHIDFHLQDS